MSSLLEKKNESSIFAFSGESLASGVYFYRLSTQFQHKAGKIILLK
jgi:hypothetical protein